MSNNSVIIRFIAGLDTSVNHRHGPIRCTLRLHRSSKDQSCCYIKSRSLNLCHYNDKHDMFCDLYDFFNLMTIIVTLKIMIYTEMVCIYSLCRLGQS